MKQSILQLVIAAGLSCAASALSAQERSLQQASISVRSALHQAGTKLTIFREWPSRKLIDTLLLTKDGATVNITDSLPAVYSVKLSRPWADAIILLDKDGAQVNFSGDHKEKVTGSVLQEKYKAYLQEMKPIEKEMMENGKNYEAEKDMEKKLLLEKENRRIFQSMQQKQMQFIQTNSDNIAGAWVASSGEYMWNGAISDKLIELFKSRPWASALTDRLYEKRKEEKALDITGKRAANFELQAINGQRIKLDSLLQANNYVLIDFWASWCTPCRSANRRIAPLYENLRKKGIELVSISVDEDKMAWEKAVAADKIPWIQLNSPGGMKGDCVSQYQVKSLPSTFLVNKEGIVVQQHLDLAELQQMITAKP